MRLSIGKGTFCQGRIEPPKAGERACNYLDDIELIVAKFRPYTLRVSVYYYMYPRARILFLVTLSTMTSVYALSEVACPLAAFGGSMHPWFCAKP